MVNPEECYTTLKERFYESSSFFSLDKGKPIQPLHCLCQQLQTRVPALQWQLRNPVSNSCYSQHVVASIAKLWHLLSSYASMYPTGQDRRAGSSPPFLCASVSFKTFFFCLMKYGQHVDREKKTGQDRREIKLHTPSKPTRISKRKSKDIVCVRLPPLCARSHAARRTLVGFGLSF